jgi:hypothetical protein
MLPIQFQSKSQFYFFSPEWSILLGGLVGGTIAYFVGELNVN